MKFYPLTTTADENGLTAEYKAAREIGNVRMGELHLFLRSGLKKYYIPYHDVRRCFRRVQLVEARMCCGRGGFEIENLVVCGDAGELIQAQLPGAKAAVILMNELQERIPEAEFGKPDEPDAPDAPDAEE